MRDENPLSNWDNFVGEMIGPDLTLRLRINHFISRAKNPGLLSSLRGAWITISRAQLSQMGPWSELLENRRFLPAAAGTFLDGQDKTRARKTNVGVALKIFTALDSSNFKKTVFDYPIVDYCVKKLSFDAFFNYGMGHTINGRVFHDLIQHIGPIRPNNPFDNLTII